VAATATPGTTIHTSQSGTSGFDEIYLYASNVTGAAATLTLEWGGATDPGNHLVKGMSIGANSGPVPIAFGHVLNNGAVVKAFSGTASAINLTGWVNRIT
jgi:hypothetical protein